MPVEAYEINRNSYDSDVTPKTRPAFYVNANGPGRVLEISNSTIKSTAPQLAS